MTPPVQPQVDHMAAIASLRQQGATDNDIEAYLKQIGAEQVKDATGPDPMVQAFHNLYQKHLLAGVMAGKSRDEQEGMPTPTQAAAESVGQGLTTLASGMPGGKLALSGMRYLGDKLPGGPKETFAQAQNAVNADADTYTRENPKSAFALKVAGSLPAFQVMPGATAAKSGAVVAGADQLLNNNPTSGAVDRLVRMMGGAAAGYGVGKVADMAVAGGRALLAKGGEAAKDAALTGRSSVTDPLYDAVRSAPAKSLTPEMQAMLQDPDVAGIAADLKQLRQWRNVPDNDPSFLMEIRKSMSDWGKQLLKQGNVLDPSKPNLIAAKAQHFGLLTDAFDKAADTQVPNFSKAVQTFAEESAPVNAQEAGYDALRRKMSGGLTSWRNIGKKTEGNFATQISRATPALQDQAAQEGAGGVLAAIRDATKQGGVGSGISALRNAPSLLATADAARSATPLPSAIQRALLALIQSKVNP